MAKEQTDLSDFSAAERERAEGALQVWHDFLCDRLPHPGEFEQHLVVFDEIASHGGGELPRNMNRHLLRSIDIDIGRGDGFSFTYAKMGPFAVLGFFEMARPREWSGGKVRVRGGLVGPCKYVLPASFYDYLVRRAKREAAVTESMSDRQRAIADSATAAGIVKNRELLRDSSWTRAALRDVEMFGDEALAPEAGKGDRKKGAG